MTAQEKMAFNKKWWGVSMSNAKAARLGRRWGDVAEHLKGAAHFRRWYKIALREAV